LNTLLPFLPAKAQGYLMGIIGIIGTLATIGRLIHGTILGDIIAWLLPKFTHGLFLGTNTPTADSTQTANSPRGSTLKMFLILFALAGLCAPLRAQTNIPSFWEDAYQWATAVNTNYSWSNVSLTLESGYKNTLNGTPAAFFGLGKKLGNFTVGGEVQMFDSSTVNQIEARFGYTIFSHYDLKVEGALYGGYDTQKSSGIIEGAICLKKLLTVNTYTFVEYALPFETAGKFNTVGQVRSGIGFSF